jgi:predicted RNase H-like HicB family nuclease
MSYRVVLIESDEGYAVGCPALPGCWSQGATREEALDNICEAIREVLEVKHELELEQWRSEGLRVETAEVDVMAHAKL